MAIDGWRIRRRIGMSGRLCTRAVARERGRNISQQEGEVLQRCHVELFIRLLLDRRPCPVSAIGMAKCYVVSLGGSVSPDRG